MLWAIMRSVMSPVRVPKDAQVNFQGFFYGGKPWEKGEFAQRPTR
jgi:hypothetical protein